MEDDNYIVTMIHQFPIKLCWKEIYNDAFWRFSFLFFIYLFVCWWGETTKLKLLRYFNRRDIGFYFWYEEFNFEGSERRVGGYIYIYIMSLIDQKTIQTKSTISPSYSWWNLERKRMAYFHDCRKSKRPFFFIYFYIQKIPKLLLKLNKYTLDYQNNVQ